MTESDPNYDADIQTVDGAKFIIMARLTTLNYSPGIKLPY
jgi:hypothetical protein